MSSFLRIYMVPIENVSVGTAVQDIFSFKTGTANGLALYQIHLEAAGVTAPAELRMRLKRGTATVTQGSGGTAPTPVAIEAKNAVAAATVTHINDTTQATTSGAFTTIAGFQWNVLGAFDFFPVPESRPTLDVSQAFVLDFPATIVATTISGYAIFEEYP